MPIEIINGIRVNTRDTRRTGTRARPAPQAVAPQPGPASALVTSGAADPEPEPDPEPVVEPVVEPEPEPVVEPVAPPLTGRGSGAAAWLEYADTIGVPVARNASKPDIVAAIDAAQS